MSLIEESRIVVPDGIADECYCHVFRPRASISYCGVPRAEQVKHGRYADATPLPSVCKCGNKICPRCRIIRDGC